jgi:TRAP-type C4-dicarboxylate transport system permease small subunit
LDHPAAAPAGAERLLLGRTCERVAVLGGVALLAAMAVLVATVIGGAFGRPLLGDSELVEFFCSVAVFAFLPYCQLRGANVIVDFFSRPLPERARDWLDAVMGLAFTGVAAVLAWRLLEGGLTAYERSKRSMFLQLPEWWGYAIGVAAMALWVVVCVWTTYLSLRRARGR